MVNDSLIINHYNELINLRQRFDGQRVGVVPTMGNLHKGHHSLIKESLLNNELTVITIFVNPKQFGPDEDFDKYPRTFEKDKNGIIELLNELDINFEKVAIFHPETTAAMFGENSNDLIKINLKGLDKVLCGKSRPGHFDGVVTVVKRIFDLTKPTSAYFGMKDYQQLLIIQELINHFKLPIELVQMPIIREKNGLARSSRNNFILTHPEDKKLILKQTIEELYKYLMTTKKILPKELAELKANLKKDDLDWDYLEVLQADDLSEISEETKIFFIAGAYNVDNTRLIDNKIANITDINWN